MCPFPPRVCLKVTSTFPYAKRKPRKKDPAEAVGGCFACLFILTAGKLSYQTELRIETGIQ